MSHAPYLGTILPRISREGKRAYPPRLSQFTEHFWNGLSQGYWQTSCCHRCELLTFPPKPICPHCWSTEVYWKALSPRGKLYSWTRIHAAPAFFADEAPYAVGVVDLDCGIRLACRLLDQPDENLSIDMIMEIVVLQFEDGPLFAAQIMTKP